MRVKVYQEVVSHSISLLLILTLTTSIFGNFSIAKAQTEQDIRLVLQITIDGLRADLINRYANGFGKIGFRLLMEKGTYYTNAHYQYNNTETIVVHATLSTGTFPSQHGRVQTKDI